MSAFWGFNDCSPWASNGTVAWLESDVYTRPPVRGDIAKLMVRGQGIAPRQIGETDCWNFPQGSRQQWINNTDQIVFNKRKGNDAYGNLIDVETGKNTELAMPVYATLASRGVGIGINFARLQRLGGYGYAGLLDASALEASPKKDGIWLVPLDGKNGSLLISLSDIASFGRIGIKEQSGHHYVTHILPSPDERKIAFLHRFWLPDGGIHTRLMSLELETHHLHVWGEGYLSHFDWRDNETIVIWGRSNKGLGKARESAGLIGNIPRPLLRLAKSVLRPILGISSVMRCNYLILNYYTPQISTLAPNSLTMDGHPSFLSSNREWMLSDTYPDDMNCRELFLMNWATREKIILTKLKNDDREVDTSRMSEAVINIDKIAMANFNAKIFAFNRSGLYCDFHPRWKQDGSAVAFDANHNGARHMYEVALPNEMEHFYSHFSAGEAPLKAIA